MIFIIGGAYQGKTAYAENRFCDGYKIIDSYHLRVKAQLEAGFNPLEEAEKLIKDMVIAGADMDRLVVISNELGYGIVPVDKVEREYREQSGRVNCYLAAKADEVIRVVCGIGTRIK